MNEQPSAPVRLLQWLGLARSAQTSRQQVVTNWLYAVSMALLIGLTSGRWPLGWWIIGIVVAATVLYGLVSLLVRSVMGPDEQTQGSRKI